MGLPGPRRCAFAIFPSLSSPSDPDSRGASVAAIFELFFRRWASKTAARTPIIATTATTPIAIPALAPALRELLWWAFESGRAWDVELVVELDVGDFEAVLWVDVGSDEVELVEEDEDAVRLKYREGSEGALAFPFSVSQRKNTGELARSKA